MKKLLQTLGTLTFFVTLPFWRWYLSRGERTRILIKCGTKVVVVKGWVGSGKWVLPGGGLHKNEDPLTGLLRELREETGLQLPSTSVRPQKTEVCSQYGITFTCHFFAAELPEEQALKAELIEISQVQWIDHSQLTSKNAGADVLAALIQG